MNPQISRRVRSCLALATAILCGVSTFATPADAADVFALGTGNGNAGATGVTVPLTAQHDQPMQGFSISVSFDSSRLQATGLDFAGTEVEVVAENGTPDYAGVTIDNVTGTMVAGVIFGFNPVPPLNQIPVIPASPDTPDLLANLVFDIDAGALPDDIPIEFDNGLGDPPVNFSEAYSQIVEGIGLATNQARLDEQAAAGLLEQSVARRESISGVNLEEEAANLIRFEQAYNASARVVAVARDIFTSLLNAIG